MESRKLFNKQQNKDLLHEPPDIYLEDHIMDIEFSPTANVMALSQVTGEVRIYSYSEKKNQEVLYFDYHKESCRCVQFSEDGNILFTAGVDGSIGIISNGR